MKKIVKKFIHKPESERTKKEKIIRDIAFFGVVVYAALATFLVFDTQAKQVEAESAAITAQIQVQHLAFNK